MIKIVFLILILFSLLMFASSNEPQDGNNELNDPLKTKVVELASNFLIIDTHIDVPYRLDKEWEDISESTEKGHFDYPLAKLGGLNAAFMSIYIPSEYEETGRGKDLADRLIDMVEDITTNNPDKFKIALSTEDVNNNFDNGILSSPLGMENGTSIDGQITNVQYFYDKGIRYITLAHAKSNYLSYSSCDEDRQYNGLSKFGETVVREMNRLGIIEMSHIFQIVHFTMYLKFRQHL
ncbi:MAG: membrane dipeptidase [Ignavibacteriaceae bacterium]